MVGHHIGKYRVTEQIGRGGMGTVYRAIDETLHREVAVKALNAELSDPTVARRFRAEAVTVARLNHPGIAMIYELVQHEGQWLMVMEFLRGETLEGLVARQGPLPVEQAADLVMQTLSALAHAHSLGVVHRDLKPANLMLAQNGLVKVMDFGIARVAGAEQLTSAGFMMGTPAYMAPEQVLGQEVDARTDLYAAALVLFYLMTGRLPFGGTTPIEMAQARVQDQPTPIQTARPDLPGWVGRVLEIALARDPGQRFQTALLFREALRRGLAHLPIETPAPATVPPELVATAAPGSLPISSPEPAAVVAATSKPIEVVKHVQPPAAEIPTVATARPVPVEPAAARLGRGPLMAGAAAVVLIGAAVIFFLWRPAEEPAQPPDTAVAAPPAASTAPGPIAADTVAAAPTPAAVAPATPAPAAAAPVVTAPASPTPDTTAAGTPAARGGARGRRGATDDLPVAFKNVRAFVVTGRKVDEREAVLQFGDARVRVTAPRGEPRYGDLPYADITSASYVRAKNPRWYPTLAAPPANVDMPGGLFRSERHWLTLQSRAGYLIVRLTDGEYRQVIETANARLRVRVEQMTARGQ